MQLFDYMKWDLLTEQKPPCNVIIAKIKWYENLSDLKI